MTKTKKLAMFIAKFYSYKFFSLMGFILPLAVVMLNQKGLNATHIAICMMTAKLVQFATEIPSGAIADTYDRRYVLIIAQLFSVFAYTIWLLMPNFLGYLLGYVCFGLNMSLSSGCTEAFLYDELKKYHKTHWYEKVHCRSEALASAGLFFSSFIASHLIHSEPNYNLLIIGTIKTAIISTFFLFLMKPVKICKKSGEPKNLEVYFKTLKKGIKYSFKHITVLKLTLFTAFVSFINMAFIEYSEIFYNELTHDLSKVAILFAIMEIVHVIGHLAGEFFEHFSTKKLILLCCITACFNVLAFNLYIYPLSPIIIMIDTIIFTGASVVISSKIHNFVTSKKRATILSVQGFIRSVGAFVTLFLFGEIVDYFGSYKIGFLTFAYICAIGGFVFFANFLRDGHLKKKDILPKLNHHTRVDLESAVA